MTMPAAFVPPAPRGIAFDIAEHVAIRSWAEARTLHVATEIDHVVAGEEYEEVLAVYEAGDTWRRLVFWRARGAVVLEPRLGPARRFGDVWTAIEAAAELIRPDRMPPQALTQTPTRSPIRTPTGPTAGATTARVAARRTRAPRRRRQEGDDTARNLPL